MTALIAPTRVPPGIYRFDNPVMDNPVMSAVPVPVVPLTATDPRVASREGGLLPGGQATPVAWLRTA